MNANTSRSNGEKRPQTVRINHRIRVPEVRVIASDGSQLGILATSEAIRLADEQGLDLIEVNAKADPPVCKISDFGKMKYEEKKKASEAKKKQTVIEVKELQIRPKTDDHDLEVKANHAKGFLSDGNKVRITCKMRGREITHPEQAHKQFQQLLTLLGQVTIEVPPKMEGRTMFIQIAPSK